MTTESTQTRIENELADDGEPEVTAPQDNGRVNAGQALSTNGVYMVLWAHVPQEEGDVPRFEEVGFYRGAKKEDAKGGNPMTAKRRAFDDPANRHLKAAAEGHGILLRAVPAQSWPEEVEPTSYTRPEPILHIN